MTELFLKYKDEYDETRSIQVRAEKFFIGRSPENNLCIRRSELSRRHAEINRFEDVFVISDCGSSNGTSVNGEQLENFPVALKDGDLINFGGSVQIEIEMPAAVSNKPDFVNEQPLGSSSDGAFQNEFGAENMQGIGNEVPAAPLSTAAANVSAPPQSSGSLLKSFFFIAPVLAVVTLVFAGGLLWLFAGRKEKPVTTASSDDYVYSPREKSDNKRRTDDEDAEKTPTPKSKETPASSETPGSSATPPSPSSTPSKSSNELDTVERSALPFMRRIAVRDETYVFSQKQLAEINSQIKSYKGSSGLRENLKAVKKDASKFEELAKSKGLKPQFLAAAALAKSGNQSPVTTAQTMLPILGELRITLNNELSDDNLLIIAAYDLGEQGKFRAMQSTLEALSKQTTGVAPNKIRTIWFLRDKGKITETEYTFALRFLAIGAIMQNPKDFGIDTEPVVF